MNEELIRLIDSIHRDKGVDKESLFGAIEAALVSAAKKRFKEGGEVTIRINRETGDIEAFENSEQVKLEEFGRIAARTAYQVMTQKIREAERDVVFGDFETKVDTLVTGTVQRTDGRSIIVNLGRTESVLPREEQVFNEAYRTGDRLRAYVVDVTKKGQKVIICLSRTNPNLVKELFALEVPEISDKVVEIKRIAREPGYRTKIAVASSDAKVDPVGACVGVKGTRIRNIVEELNGERVDIVRWHDSDDVFIKGALKPAEVTAVDLDKDSHRARVIVPEDQLSLAIGKKGLNVRLSARISGWDISVLTEDEARRERERERAEMKKLAELIDGVDEGMVDQLVIHGFSTLRAIVIKGREELANLEWVGPELAGRIHEHSAKRVEELEIEREKERAARAAAAAEAAAAEAAAAEAAAREAKEE